MAAAIRPQLGDRMPIKREDEAERELAKTAKERGRREEQKREKNTHTHRYQTRPASRETNFRGEWLVGCK